MAITAIAAIASTTIPLKGTVIKASDPRIVYTGRISFANPEAPTFSYPGTQIMACFEGTSLKVMAKPMSGYFMAQIDQAEPFKVGFMAPKDSVVTVATALADGRHLVKLMYVVEGLDLKPVFKGFILDEGRQLAPPPALPQRKIEFIGNSITCGSYIFSSVPTTAQNFLLIAFSFSGLYFFSYLVNKVTTLLCICQIS